MSGKVRRSPGRQARAEPAPTATATAVDLHSVIRGTSGATGLPRASSSATGKRSSLYRAGVGTAEVGRLRVVAARSDTGSQRCAASPPVRHVRPHRDATRDPAGHNLGSRRWPTPESASAYWAPPARRCSFQPSRSGSFRESTTPGTYPGVLSSRLVVTCTARLTVLTQRADPLGRGLIVCHEGSRIAIAPRFFDG